MYRGQIGLVCWSRKIVKFSFPICFIYKTRELNTARGHDAFAAACVMDSPACWHSAPCVQLNLVKSFATWQHRFDVDSDFLSYPAPLCTIHFAQTVISSSADVAITSHKCYRNPFSMRGQQNVDTRHRDNVADIGTTGHSENNSVRHARSLAEAWETWEWWYVMMSYQYWHCYDGILESRDRQRWAY